MTMRLGKNFDVILYSQDVENKNLKNLKKNIFYSYKLFRFNKI